jgi:hypothetical protein
MGDEVLCFDTGLEVFILLGLKGLVTYRVVTSREFAFWRDRGLILRCAPDLLRRGVSSDSVRRLGVAVAAWLG